MQLPRERASTIAVLTAIPMVAQLIAGRAVRDAVFLSEYDAVYLPRVMLVAAALSLGAALLVGRAMPHFGPRRTALVLTLINGALFAAEGALLSVMPKEVAVVTYVHVSFVGALVVSAFSSVINERFDPHYAKTVVAQVGTGAALGGVLGGASALLLSNVLDLRAIFLGIGALSVLIGAGVWSIGVSGSEPGHSTDESGRYGTRAIRDDPYLRKIAIAVILLGAVGVLVDYAMKAEADARFPDSAGLLSFFATFYMATALVTFLMQAGVARPLLEKVGLGWTMAVLPITVAVSAGVGVVWTRLWTATIARGSQTVLSSSLFRSGYELLYTPIPPLKKRATKAPIDIACNRIGYGLGSALIMGIVAIASSANAATTWVMAAATAGALVSAWMIRRLHSGYVEALAASLRAGSLVLRSEDVADATTLHTLARTEGALDRHEILERVGELHRDRDTNSDVPDAKRDVDQLAKLLSDDSEGILEVLLDPALSTHFASYVISMLADDRHAGSAYRALERMGAPITGQLVDAMLRRSNPVSVRQRVPRLLRRYTSSNAVYGLLEGLEDPAFEVRYRCGRALSEIQRSNPELNLPHHRIMNAVERDLAIDDQQWLRRRHPEKAPTNPTGEVDALLVSRRDRNLQHVFTLLGLAFDRDAIALSLRALSSDNANLRGTSLEYLHNVLPEDVRDTLWPRLTERAARRHAKPKTRSPDELLQTMRSLMIDRDRLDR